MASSQPSPDEAQRSPLGGNLERLAQQDLTGLQEAIAKGLLRLIVPWAAALAIAVLAGELISEGVSIRLVPSVALAGLFGYLAFVPLQGRPLLRTWIIIATVYLSMAYLGWAVQSFRAPAVVGLAMILITWTCMFTTRKIALGVLFVLLTSNAVIYLLMHSGVYLEEPLSPAYVSFFVLSGIYGALFISVLAPTRILFESVLASRRAEQTATRALEEQQRSRNFTIQAVDNSLQMFGWLTPDGILQFANATALSMVRASPTEVIGARYWDTPWFCHAPIEQERLKRAIVRASQGETVRYETTHRNAEGVLRDIEFSLHPIVETDGSISMLVAEGRDATEENQTIRQKELLSERLHQSQKMEVIGQLTGGVAHDFNNNLSSIGGLTELLKSGVADEAQRLEYIDMILEATANAKSLTRRLLAFSRKETHKLDNPVDLVALLKSVASMLQRTQDKRVVVSVESQLECAIILCDESMLQNAFLNMGINAFHAMPNGGRLDFRLVARHLDAADCDLLTPAIFPGKYFELAIGDTGCGMPPEVASRIFEPFYTTKEAGKGTGLGMSMVYDTLKELGGSIAVDSKLGVGTTIRVYLQSPPSAESTPD